MTTLISYAQNFEDVMLWRALKHVEKGRYIDVGAQDPTIDSVSKFFYEKGWQGIHVEPVPTYAAQLRQQRPDDLVLQAAVGIKSGMLEFYEFPDTGLSTPDIVIAKKHLRSGFAWRETVVPCITLDDVLANFSGQDIHWLKIDVEGGEQKALKSWAHSDLRPWIVVIESTIPLTQIESHKKWEPFLIAKGYTFAYFDGLNRFYISTGHNELINAFSVGPNLFDGFALSRSSWPWGANLSFELQAAEASLDEERKATGLILQDHEVKLQVQLDKNLSDAHAAERVSAVALADLTARLAASSKSEAEVSITLANNEQIHGKQLSAIQHIALEATQQLAFREVEFNAKLTAILENSKQMTDTLVEREHQFAMQLEKSVDASKVELFSVRNQYDEIQQALSAKGNELGQLRQELKWRLDGAAQELALQDEQAAASYRKLESTLNTEVSQLTASLATSVGALAFRQQGFETQLQAAHQQTLAAAKFMAVREREFADQLQAREKLLRAEISAFDQEISNLKNIVIERDRHIVELGNTAEREAAAVGQIRARKEFAFSATLASLETQFSKATAAVQLTLAQISGQRDALELKAHLLRQQLVSSQDEVSGLAGKLVDSETAVASLQQELEKGHNDGAVLATKLTDLKHVTATQALAAQLERSESERLGAHREWQLNQEMRRLEAELTRTMETAGKVEGQLTEQLQSISQNLRQKASQLTELQNLRKAMVESVSWRLTTPLRSINAFLGQRNNYDVGSFFSSEDSLSGLNSGALSSLPIVKIGSSVLSTASTIGDHPRRSENYFESHAMKNDNVSYGDLAALNGANFVENCYQKLLRRPVDDTGLAGYVRALNLGTSKAEVVQAILLSDEGKLVGVHVEWLSLATFFNRLESVPLLGGVLAIFMLFIKSKSVLRNARIAESLDPAANSSKKCFSGEIDSGNFQHKFDQLVPAFLHTISHANAFMHECRQRLSEVESSITSAPENPRSFIADSTNERLLALETLAESKAKLLDQVQLLVEPVQNLVNSVPLANRATFRTLTELRSQLNAVHLQLCTILPIDKQKHAEKKPILTPAKPSGGALVRTNERSAKHHGKHHHK